MIVKLSTCLLVALLAIFAASASAQGRGPGGGPPGGGPGGPGGSRGPLGPPLPMSPGGAPSGSRTSTASGSPSSTSSGTLGRWWDDRAFASSIGIDSRQQKRLDQVFTTNKPTLVTLYGNLQKEQQQLETLRGKNASESELFPQIDRVTQARGDLQKAYAHLQLQIRKELTPEQTSRLDEHR